MSKKPGAATTSVANNPALVVNHKPQRRPDPIILLSPSASSLLRMSNAKSFLEDGRYEPADHNSTATMLHISRKMPDIDPSRPMRFILVEGPEQFKPEYWNRVVAVFTTGQAWQFKNYRWSNPSELFKHVPGLYLGWRGEKPPETIRAFGSRVQTFQVEKLRGPAAPGAEASRWRDREVVETIWKAIGTNMRHKGWRKDAIPSSI
jgi:parafibromin